MLARVRSLGRALVLACLGWFVSVAHSSEVTLAWDPNSEPNVTGYNIYYGTQSRQYDVFLDASSNTTRQVSSLERGRTYYFAVTAYNADLLESPFSDEVSYTVPTATTNATPILLTITPVAGAPIVTVTFSGQPGEQSLVQASINLQSWQTIHTVSNIVGTYQWTDTDAPNHPKRFYRVMTWSP